MPEPVAPSVTAAADIRVDQVALDASIRALAGRNGDDYVTVFRRIHDQSGFMPRSLNLWAGILGPFWAAARGVWGMF